MSEKIACMACVALILVSTAAANGGLCAPCKRGDRKKIEDAKLRRAEQKIAEPNPDPVTRRWRWLRQQAYQVPVSAENQTYYTVTCLETGISSGGLRHFFEYRSDDDYADALRGLEEVGAAECRILLVAAKQLFFGAGDMPGTQTRYRGICQAASARGEQLTELDAKFQEAAVRLRDLIEGYAQKDGLYDGF